MSGLVILLVMLGLVVIGCGLLYVLPGTPLDQFLIDLFGGEPE